MARLDELKTKFKDRIDNRNITTPNDFHEIFYQMDSMEIGEEIIDDVWTIIKIPNGWIIKRLNFGTVFVPQTL